MLETYKKKRDFSRTPEPAPGAAPAGFGALRFVVQKHSARGLHYDFRLELDGVLKSWAVPKGPSLDPAEKRLAVLVEDHPLDYAPFEGVIARGNYGAGEVIVWDAGVYSPDEGGKLSFDNREEAQERMRGEIEAGKLSFTLRGRKLRGSWTLVKTSRSPKDWLLIKHKDRHVDTEQDVLDEEASVQSGLTLADLKAGRLPSAPGALERRLESAGKQAAFPKKLKPMLARLIEDPFSDPAWLFEPKLDGFRALAFLHEGRCKLKSRNGNDLTDNYPEVVAELEAQPQASLLLDGEMVALDEQARPDFGLMQQTVGDPGRIERPDRTANVVYYPFDLLYANGVDVKNLPLTERKALLAQAVVPGDRVQPVEYVAQGGVQLYNAASQVGFEGIVAKRGDSRYEPGIRSRSWLKVKRVNEQEFVVGGYTAGSGARASTFGSLLVGYYDDTGLRLAGKVGTGLDDAMLKQMLDLMRDLEVDDSPFVDDPDVVEEIHWVRPRLVVRVKFAQWTHEDRLRAPVFTGVDPDRDAREVRREIPDLPVSVGPAEQEPQPSPKQTDTAEVLAQLDTDRKDLILEVDGHRVSLTNLDKPFWPAYRGREPITKGDMIRYYARMGPVLIPHLRDRPLTLTRYPNGIEGQSFYQKNWEHRLPEFVETVRLFSSHNDGDVEYVMVNNLPTLIWLAQLADLEMHPWLSRTARDPDAGRLTADFAGSEEALEGSALNYPDFIVFDLDPYIYSGKEKAGDEPELNRRAFAKTVEVARALKEVLDELHLSSFLKTSGKTGLHIYVPVLRQYDFGVARKSCELIGRFLMQQRPREITMEWTVSKRSGKVFLDHNQNVRGKNMASIYSLRPAPNAPVSTPLRWDELDGTYPTDLTIDVVPNRVDRIGDLWSGILDAKHDLRRILDIG